MTIDKDVIKHYLADSPTTVVPLEIKTHFEALNDEEKLYAHYISVASFAGTRIILRQVSKESEAIYDFIIAIYKAFGGDWKSIQAKAALDDEDMAKFLDYAAQFLGNNGNYKSFGDSKFIPRLAPDKLAQIARLTPEINDIYLRFKDLIYENKTIELLHFGYPDAGHISNYYPDSPDITKDDITAVSKFLEGKKLLPENTRVRKVGDTFEVLIASAQSDPSASDRDIPESEWEVNGKKILLKFGDHFAEMGKISEALTNAKNHAANDTQKNLMTEYVNSFKTGSLYHFVESQRYWIRDKGPTVESNIGFIETYRDPHGIRGEWEGFAAMVNKERTRAFGALVEAAPSLIPKLPWSKDFEKDHFLAPDFTSLEVLTFAGSGIPAGINIPNYDSVRQTEGFKNVSLGNVLSAKAPNEKIPFISDEDLEVYQKYRDPAFEVQVGLHELLGHGCGKLLQETETGKYNFDITNPPIDPFTEKPITSWYKPGETWSSVFGSMAASYEECRAETVAMALSCDFGVLKIFGFGDGSEDINGPAGDVLYASYLSMARAGIAALEFWDPKSRKWGQAHMQARFSILRTFLAAGQGFAELKYEKENLDDLVIHIDRNKITSVGRKAVEVYLQKLQVIKATADFAAGKAMYDDITHVDEFYANKLRPVVLAKKLPRKVFVQANTVIKDGKATLIEYPATPQGLIASFAERNYI